MRLRLSDWRPRHLLAAWCLYWIALALATLGPVVPKVWHATRPGAHGSVSLSFGDGVFRLAVLGAGTEWTGTAGVGALVLWLAVPPLVLWALWLASRRRIATGVASRAAAEEATDSHGFSRIGPGDPENSARRP